MGFSKGVFRYFLLFLLLVLSVSFCFALVVDSTGFEGVNPVMYGEFVVFESVNGSVGVLDIYRNEVFDFGQGSNPSLFGLNIVFEEFSFYRGTSGVSYDAWVLAGEPVNINVTLWEVVSSDFNVSLLVNGIVVSNSSITRICQ